MKIMWIVNSFVGALATKHGGQLTSGQWLNAEIENEKELKENELIVCTSGMVYEECKENNISYVVLPHGLVANYQVTEANVNDWSNLIDVKKPDLILVWGTEYAIGRAVLKANNKKLPSAVYIQGVMSSIVKNYRGGLSDKSIKKMTTIIEKLRNRTIFDMEEHHRINAENEKECILLTDSIILENDWSEGEYRKILPDIKVYRSRLPIKKSFSEYQWKEGEYIPHSIVTVASSYPLKGLHVLLPAIALVKKNYPDVCVSIPGKNEVYVNGIVRKLKQGGYNKFIKKCIMLNNLEDNVKFVGPLTSDEYAMCMKKSEIFVTSSAIENHGSSLREAMSVGVPCVASAVGGIPEYAQDHINCSLFEFGSSEELADAICELFESENMRTKYSCEGKRCIFAMYNDNPLLSLNEIYKKIIKSVE